MRNYYIYDCITSTSWQKAQRSDKKFHGLGQSGTYNKNLSLHFILLSKELISNDECEHNSYKKLRSKLQNYK